MRNILRVLFAAAVIAGLCLTSFAANLPAASAQTSANTITNITKNMVISEKTVIPENETLYVRNGGNLYINEGVKVKLLGTIKVADGGAVYIRGSVICANDSVMSVSGKVKILKSGNLTLNSGSKLKINSTGVFKGNGTLSVKDKFSDISCSGTVNVHIEPPKPVKEGGVTYVGGVILVNKKYHLPKDYGNGLDSYAYSAYLKMREASGYDMSILSGYRSYAKQTSVFNYWCSVDGYTKARTYSALPGQSEHQTGLAIDISSLEESYADTPEGKWLAANCYKYGFIIRYPKDGEAITGYIYEPWHVRYLGESTAKLVYDSGLTLEQFLGVS